MIEPKKPFIITIFAPGFADPSESRQRESSWRLDEWRLRIFSLRDDAVEVRRELLHLQSVSGQTRSRFLRSRRRQRNGRRRLSGWRSGENWNWNHSNFWIFFVVPHLATFIYSFFIVIFASLTLNQVFGVRILTHDLSVEGQLP